MNEKQRQILELSEEEMIDEGTEAGKMSALLAAAAIAGSRFSAEIGTAVSTITAAVSGVFLSISVNRWFYSRYLHELQKDDKRKV